MQGFLVNMWMLITMLILIFHRRFIGGDFPLYFVKMIIYYIDEIVSTAHRDKMWKNILLAYYKEKSKKIEVPECNFQNVQENILKELQERSLFCVDPLLFTYICYKPEFLDDVYYGASFISGKENIVIFPYSNDFNQMLSIALHEILHIEIERGHLRIPNGFTEEEYVTYIEHEIINIIKEKS